MGRFYFWLFFSSLICCSTQQNIKLTQSSNNPSEGELLTLRCVAAPGYDLFQWSLDDEIVVESTTTNYTLAYGKNESQYAVSITTNRVGKHILRLDIKPVSRHDEGRWECLASSTSGAPAFENSRTSITVNYFPDPEYPVCEITAAQRASCTTQEGRPLVGLRWTEESQGSVAIIPERDSTLDTRNSIMFSELEPSVLRPPEANSDAIFCKIEQNLESRQCSIIKQDIYALASLNISQVVNEKTTVSCTVEPSYFRSFLQLSWEHAENLQGNVSNIGNNSKEVNFGEVTPNLDGTKVICTLVWGVIDNKNVSLSLVVNVPPTTLAHFPTIPPSRMSSSKPTIRPFLDEMTTKRSVDKDHNVKTVEPEPDDVIKVTTKRESRDVVTPTTETELMFTFTDWTTDLIYEFEKNEGQMIFLAVVLSALILPILLLLCIVCICVLCKRKKGATATVV